MGVDRSQRQVSFFVRQHLQEAKFLDNNGRGVGECSQICTGQKNILLEENEPHEAFFVEENLCCF